MLLYNMDSSPAAPDLTSIEVKLDASVEHPAKIVKLFDPEWLTAGGMPIDAGATGVSVSHSLENTTDRSFFIWSAGLHMHQLGASGRLNLTHADGADEGSSDEMCLGMVYVTESY